MIIYDQLRVSDDGQTLFINAHVNNAEYFQDVYIKKITICTEDQISELDPFGPYEQFIYQQEIEGTETKSLDLVLGPSQFYETFTAKDLSHYMFFVYIECDGTVPPETPCRLDEMTTLGVTFDYGVFYNNAMNFTKELADTCTIPSQFIDFILNMEALKMSIETEHYVPAIKYWKTLLGTDSANISENKPCGCHG